MKREKLYFSDFDEEMAYTLDDIIDEMKERGYDRCEVSLAVRETDKSYYFCKMVREAYMKPPNGEPCGKECFHYVPRNHKSGCCKHRGYCYIPGEEFELTLDGKLVPIKRIKPQ